MSEAPESRIVKRKLAAGSWAIYWGVPGARLENLVLLGVAFLDANYRLWDYVRNIGDGSPKWVDAGLSSLRAVGEVLLIHMRRGST